MTTTVAGCRFDESGMGGAAWHTSREIAQQPTLWRYVGKVAMERRRELEQFVGCLLERPDLRVVLTGAGTSAFAGAILAPALARELGRRVDAVPTTDIVSSPRQCFAEDLPTLLVSFARSGDSPESVAATELAEQCLSDVHHLVITCNPAGELRRRHDGANRSLVLLMPAQADDQGFAMTSSFTSMALAAILALRRSAVDDALVDRLAAAAEQVLAEHGGGARTLAARGYDRVVYLGSGALTGLARESALKLLELTAGRIVTYFDSALAFRHGPKAVLDDRTLAVVYVSNDPYTRQYDLDIVDELRGALGADHVVAVFARATGRPEDDAGWRVDGLDDANDGALALPFALVAQLLGLHFSLALGMTPDNPFPSGEVNRVVQGVTVYSLVD